MNPFTAHAGSDGYWWQSAKKETALKSCPECKSHDIDLTWVTPTCGLPEYQCGHCNDCGETWNQCARD